MEDFKVDFKYMEEFLQEVFDERGQQGLKEEAFWDYFFKRREVESIEKSLISEKKNLCDYEKRLLELMKGVSYKYGNYSVISNTMNFVTVLDDEKAQKFLSDCGFENWEYCKPKPKYHSWSKILEELESRGEKLPDSLFKVFKKNKISLRK